MINFLKNYLNSSKHTLDVFLSCDNNFSILEKIVLEMTNALSTGKKIISCGNGGSMCDAMHFAEELTGRFKKDRPPLPAMAISDPSHITCTANDYGFDNIFSRFVEAHGTRGDVLLAISTSGNSKNVLLACEVAKAKGMSVVALLGNDGGKLKSIADFSLIVDQKSSDKIQEVHIKLIHTMIAAIELRLFGH